MKTKPKELKKKKELDTHRNNIERKENDKNETCNSFKFSTVQCNS